MSLIAALLLTAANICGVIHEDKLPPPPPPDVPVGVVNCVPGTTVFLMPSYVLWKVQFDDAWVTSRLTSVNTDGISVHRNDYAPQFHCSSGIKFGVGINFSEEGWSTLARWTYVHASPKRSWHADNHSLTNSLSESTVIGDEALGANHVTGAWWFNFNALDLELGKNFQITAKILQRAFVCLRMCSVNNKLHAHYSDLISLDGLATHWPDQKVEVTNQAWLIGPRGGLNQSFTMFGDFGLIGTAATAVFITVDEPHYTIHANSPGGTPIGVKDKFPQMVLRPAFDVFIGLNWSHCFDRKYLVNATVGFEAQYISQAVQPYESLNMYGLTTTLIVNF